MEVNSNFNQQVSDATMDLVGDDTTQLLRSNQKTKWDRKKKKFVSTQSINDKSKKMKTESGSYINASYKSDFYAKWLKNNKQTDRDDADNDDNDDNQQGGKYKNKKKQFFGSSLEG
jgi:ATP-dependent RNA helicase DDX54/DBP10